jgi:hypothetical protein
MRRHYLWRYVIRPLVKSYGERSNETLSPFIILIRFRRSLPAIVASTVRPASSSIANIPALNFSTTLPITSIASSFGNLLYLPVLIWITITAGCLGYRRDRPPPPPLPRNPPPPDARSVFGRASLTFSARPSRSVPFKAAMARSPSALSLISTNPKPLA